MKFLRIFPEMCAKTTCLFSSSTLNMALGSVSTTVPTTSMASSFGILGAALEPLRYGGMSIGLPSEESCHGSVDLIHRSFAVDFDVESS